MDCFAVFIFLCLFSAEVGSRTVKEKQTGASNAIVHLMREEIQTILGHLAVPGLLPNISCLSFNTTKLVNAHQLSSFRCQMQKMSELTPELSVQLLITCQYTQDLERLTSGLADLDCSLPTFEQDVERYVYLKCILKLLDQQLSSVKF